MRRLTAPFVLLVVIAACSTPTPGPDTTRPPVSIPSPVAPSTTTTISEPSETTSQRSPGEPVTVYMDGWSVRLAGTTTLLADGSQNQQQQLKPLNAEEIEELPGDVLEQIAARLVTADKSWSCVKGYCKSAAGTTIDSSQFANPTTIPHYGEVYASHGVKHGVWAATFQTDTDRPFVHDYRTSEGWMIVGSPGDQRIAPETTQVALGAGFGVLFPLDTYYSTPGTAGYWFDLYEGEADPDLILERDRELADAFTAGPGSNTAGLYLRRMSNSELTAITSPTIGCGSDVACSPDATVKVLEEITPRTALQICAGDQPAGVAVVFNEIREYNYPNITHQYGVWGTAHSDPSPFTPDGYAGLIGPTPTLTSGTQKVQVKGIHFWAPMDSFGGDVFQLVTHASDAAHLTDSTGPFKSQTPEEILAEMAPSFVSACQYEIADRSDLIDDEELIVPEEL